MPRSYGSDDLSAIFVGELNKIYLEAFELLIEVSAIT